MCEAGDHTAGGGGLGVVRAEFAPVRAESRADGGADGDGWKAAIDCKVRVYSGANDRGDVDVLMISWDS